MRLKLQSLFTRSFSTINKSHIDHRERDIMITSYILDKALALVNQYKSGDLFSIATGEGILIMKDPIDLPKGVVLGIAAVCKWYRSIYL